MRGWGRSSDQALGICLMFDTPTTSTPLGSSALSVLEKERANLEDIFSRSSSQVFIKNHRSQRALHLSQTIDELISEYRALFRGSSVDKTFELSEVVASLWKRLLHVIDLIYAFSDILHPSYLDFLDELYPFVSANFLMTKGYSLIVSCFYKPIKYPKELVYKYKKYAEGIEYLSAYVQECMQHPELDKSSTLYLDVAPFSDYLMDFIETPFSINKVYLSNSKIKKLQSYSSRIRRASQDISYDIYRLNNYLTDCIDNQIIYIDPETAEGKALKRMEQPEDEIDWIVINDENESEVLDKLFASF